MGMFVMYIETVKSVLKEINFKNYFIHQIEPSFQDFSYGFSIIKEDYIDFIKLDKDGYVRVIGLYYNKIDNVKIDNIFVDIIMQNGVVFHLKQIRPNLIEILKDFSRDFLLIDSNKKSLVFDEYKVMDKGKFIRIIGIKDDIFDKIEIHNADILYIEERYEGKIYGERVIYLTTKYDEIIIYGNSISMN